MSYESITSNATQKLGNSFKLKSYKHDKTGKAVFCDVTEKPGEFWTFFLTTRLSFH